MYTELYTLYTVLAIVPRYLKAVIKVNEPDGPAADGSSKPKGRIKLDRPPVSETQHRVKLK